MHILRVKPSTLTIAGLIVVFIGVLMITSTAYQELVEDVPPPEELTPEDYHMGMGPTPKYEWRSRSPVITMIGGILCAVGAVILVVVFVLVYLEDLI